MATVGNQPAHGRRVIGAIVGLAGALVALIPPPDPAIRRARLVRQWSATVARLEALPKRTPAQEGRLAGARAALGELSGEG